MENMDMNTQFVTSRYNSRLDDDFDNIQHIGEGAYGQVVKARGKVDGKLYAIKKVRIDYQRNNVLEQNVFKEVRHLAVLEHENVVRYFDSWIENCSDVDDSDKASEEEDDDFNDDCDDGIDDGLIVFKNYGSSNDRSKHGDKKSTVSTDRNLSLSLNSTDESAYPEYVLLCIKMELCEHGTLRDSIIKGLSSDNKMGWKFLRDILCGLEYIHRKDIIHRDLNPNNIFISSNGSAKIGDFGVATFEMLNGDCTDSNKLCPTANTFMRQRSQLSGKAGTELYAAPEVETPTATKYTYDKRADMYSLGFVVFEMFNPAIETHMEKVEIFQGLKAQTYPDGFDNVKMSDQIRIIEKLLIVDPQDRYTASDILNPENTLLPCEQVEEKHLHTIRIAVRDPKSKERQIILKEIFDTPDDIGFPNDSKFGVIVPKSEASRKVSEMTLLDAFRNACSIHGAIEIALPPMITPENKNDVVKFISEKGETTALTDDHMVPVAKYITKAKVSDAKMYCTQPVYKRSGNVSQPNRILQFSFHVVSPKPSVIATAETLCLLQKFVLSGTNCAPTNYRIGINHNSIICGVLDMCGVPRDVRASLLGSPLLATIRYRLMDYHRMGISKELNDKLVRIFSKKGSPMAIRDMVKSELGRIDDALGSVFNELYNVIKTAKLMGLKLPITVIPNFTVAQNPIGMVFRLTRQKKQKQATIVATGGDFTSLLSAQWRKADVESGGRSRSRGGSKDIPSWISLKVHVDRIVTAEVDANDAGARPESMRAFNCDVVVHYDAKRQQEGVVLVRTWWENGVRAKLMEDNPSKIQLKDYKRLGVSYVVSIDIESGKDRATIIDLRIGIKAKEVCPLSKVMGKLGRKVERLELNKEMERSPTPNI